MNVEDCPKNTAAMKGDENREPVSWATLFCRLFAHVAREVTDRFGEEGEQAIKEGVRAFGVERGRNIAERAKAKGEEIGVRSYLPNYDMNRGDDFTAQNTYADGEVRQLFTQCGFAEQWARDGMEKYGKLYCDVIDPAIAEGFCEDMECIRDRHIYEDGVCSFCFRIKKKSASE